MKRLLSSPEISDLSLAPGSLPAWSPSLVAPAHWQQVDCISDLHMHAGDGSTVHMLRHYLQTTVANALIILGDLFEVWIGDDALQPGSFEAHCAQVLRHAASRMAVYVMHGNRDFLLGNEALLAFGAQGLADPCAFQFGSYRYLLSHGDALCLDDHAYLKFRKLVRSKAWQLDFLAQALPQRRAQALQMRTQSEARKQSGYSYPDVDSAAAISSLQTHDCSVLLHGHTHRPADHQLAHGLQRLVLSDWDGKAQPPRAQVLQLKRDGARHRINLASTFA